MKFFPYVFKNLFRKKTRSILTLGSILVLLFAICIMGTLLATLSRDPSDGKGMYRLVVRHKVSLTNFIPEAYGEKIRQLGGIEEMSIWCWFGGKYIDYSAKNQFARFAVEPDRFLKVFDEARIIEGSAEDWISDRSGALVGDLLMEKYGWKLGQKVTLAGDIYPITVELTIRAVYTGPQNAALFFNWKYVEEALPRIKGRIGTFYIKADSPEAAARLPKEIDAMFENSDTPTKTETEKEFQNGFLSMLGNVKLILNGISIAILFVILLITANTIAMSARERVTEIAVLRTLGFRKGTILGMILGESFLLSIFGSLVGIVFFIGIFPVFKKALMSSQMSGFAAGMRLFPSVLAVGFAVAVFVGLVAGLFPAIRSAQRSIPDGLRQVG
jgi:putative ABC transport system permease protein